MLSVPAAPAPWGKLGRWEEPQWSASWHWSANPLYPQVFQLAAHLVYWGKAIIIYPLCENNVYMLSPNASVCL